MCLSGTSPGQHPAPTSRRLPRRIQLPLVCGFRVKSFEYRHRVPSCVEFISVAAAQPRFGARRSEGARPLARIIAPQACIRWTRGDPDHDAAMRIGGKAPGRRPILERGMRAMGRTGHRHLGSSSPARRGTMGGPRTVSAAPLRPSPLTPPDAGRHRPASRSGHQTPQRDDQLARQRHDHGLARAAAASAVRAPYQTAGSLASWNRRKRQAGWIMPRRTRAFPACGPLLPRPGAALLRRARRPAWRVTALGHESARRPRRQHAASRCRRRSRVPTVDHRVRRFVGCLSQIIRARLLDLGDLAAHEADRAMSRRSWQACTIAGSRPAAYAASPGAPAPCARSA